MGQMSYRAKNRKLAEAGKAKRIRPYEQPALRDREVPGWVITVSAIYPAFYIALSIGLDPRRGGSGLRGR